MSKVRLRYPILVNYVGNLYRVLAAIAFAIIVIRKLGVYQFGIWTVAFSLSSFFALPAGTWFYWMSRFLARGFRESMPTGGVVTLLYAAIASCLYVATAWLVSARVGGFSYLATFGLALMLTMLLMNWLASAVSVVKPEVNGYAALLFQSARVALAYALVAQLGMGLSGAFIAVISSRLITAAYMALQLSRCGVRVLGPFSRELASSWFKRMYIPLLSALDAQVRSFDRTIAALVTGSASVPAIMGAAYAAQTPVGGAGASASAVLRARLLRAPRASDVEESLKMVLLLGGFTASTLVALSKPVLSLLNPVYVSAYLAFSITAVSTLVLSLASVYVSASMASERSDLDLARELRSTRLFRTPAAKLCCDLAALAVATGVAYALRNAGGAWIASVYATAWLCSSAATLAIARRHALEALRISFPVGEALRVALASLATVATYVALGAPTLIVASFWRDAPKLATYVVIGAATYFAVMLCASSWFRNLARLAVTRILGL